MRQKSGDEVKRCYAPGFNPAPLWNPYGGDRRPLSNSYTRSGI